jgi:hypothetical protein
VTEKKSSKKKDTQNDVVDGVMIRRPEWAKPAPAPRPVPEAAVGESAEPVTAQPVTARPVTAKPVTAKPGALEPDTVEIEHLPPRPAATTSAQPSVAAAFPASSEPMAGSDTVVTTQTGDGQRRWLSLPRAGAAAAAVAVCLLGGAAWTLAGNGDDDTHSRNSAAGRTDLPLVVLGDPSVPEGSTSSSAQSPSAEGPVIVVDTPSDTASSETLRGSTVSRDQQRTDPATTTGTTAQQQSTTTQPGTSSSTSSSSSSSSSSAPSTGRSSSPGSPSGSPSSPPSSSPGEDDQGTGSPSPTESTSPTSSPTCFLGIVCR